MELMEEKLNDFHKLLPGIAAAGRVTNKEEMGKSVDREIVDID